MALKYRVWRINPQTQQAVPYGEPFEVPEGENGDAAAQHAQQVQDELADGFQYGVTLMEFPATTEEAEPLNS